MKKLALALTLALTFAGSTFAGETSTPPCPQPVPGETSTPPCDGSSTIGDSNTTTLGESLATVADDVTVEVFVSAVDTVFMLF